jgi:hypothetical protein
MFSAVLRSGGRSLAVNFGLTGTLKVQVLGLSEPVFRYMGLAGVGVAQGGLAGIPAQVGGALD